MAPTPTSLRDGFPLAGMKRRAPWAMTAPSHLLDALRHVELLTGSATGRACAADRRCEGRRREEARIKLHGPVEELWPEIEARQAEGAWRRLVVVNEGGQRGAEIKRIRALFDDGDDVLADAWHIPPDFLVVRDAQLARVLAGERTSGRRLRGCATPARRALWHRPRGQRSPARHASLAGTRHQKDPATRTPWRWTIAPAAVTVGSWDTPAPSCCRASRPGYAPPRPQRLAQNDGPPLPPKRSGRGSILATPDCPREEWRDLIALRPCRAPMRRSITWRSPSSGPCPAANNMRVTRRKPPRPCSRPMPPREGTRRRLLYSSDERGRLHAPHGGQE